MEIYTIGFTQTTAEHFFERLADARVGRVLDVRLRNSSQLAGFAKATDLVFFLDRLIGVGYRHEPMLAPSDELLRTYRAGEIDWGTYEHKFLDLMRERRIESRLAPGDFDVPTALLCSEPRAERCHRRLVCNYLAGHWPEVQPVHL